MKIAHYWTRASGEATDSEGNQFRTTVRGWSDEGLDSARTRAQDIARRVAQRLAAEPGVVPRYPYGDRPLPEAILSEFRDPGGSLSAVITRNSYGALVMNTDQMMFVDIDGQSAPSAPQSGLKGLFAGLFGQPAPSPVKVDPYVEAAGTVAGRHGLSARVYRTAAGYRVLITDRRFSVTTSETEALLKEFAADPLYVRLCRMQESFRARLSPKPWRCEVRQPPVEFPFETPADEARFRDWEREYESATANYATCAYVTAFGPGRVLPEFEALIRVHDEKTKAATSLPLA